MRTGRVIDHLVNINKLKRAYTREVETEVQPEPRDEEEDPIPDEAELSENEVDEEESSNNETKRNKQKQEHAGAKDGGKQQSARLPKQTKQTLRGRDPSDGGHASRGLPSNLPTPLVQNRPSSQKGMEPEQAEAVPTGVRSTTPNARLNKPGAPKNKTQTPNQGENKKTKTQTPNQGENKKTKTPTTNEREIAVELSPKVKKIEVAKRPKHVSFQEIDSETDQRRHRKTLELTPPTNQNKSDESNEESDGSEDVQNELSEREEESSEERLSEEENAEREIKSGKTTMKVVGTAEKSNLSELGFCENTRQKRAVTNWTDQNSQLPMVEEEKESVKLVQKKQVRARDASYKTLKAREQSERLIERQKRAADRTKRVEARRRARDLQYQQQVGAIPIEEETAPEVSPTIDKAVGKVTQEEGKLENSDSGDATGVNLVGETSDSVSSDSSI